MKKNNRSPPGEPYWAPLPHQQLTRLRTASIIGRNAAPLIGVLFFGQSAGNFVLLCAFNLALTIAGIGVVGVAVPQHGNYVGTADRICGAGRLLPIGLGITLVLTALFGWAIAVFVTQSELALFNRSLFWSALSIVLCALPEMWRQYTDDIRSKSSEKKRKQRDQPIVFAHVFNAGLIFMLTPCAFRFGRAGTIVAAMAITALVVFRDLRPDLVRQLARPGRSG